MTDKIRSILNAELTMLPYKFFDLEDANRQKNQLESRHKLKASELFQKQWRLDKMRATDDNGKSNRKANDFNALCALYFEQFLKSTGFDFVGLEKELGQNKAVMERHLGKPWVLHLELLLKLSKEVQAKVSDAPTRGLLKRAV